MLPAQFCAGASTRSRACAAASAWDPRPNRSQFLDLAFLVAGMYRQQAGQPLTPPALMAGSPGRGGRGRRGVLENEVWPGGGAG
jgi:hypothetical protein